jgi:hypothetical protein
VPTVRKLEEGELVLKVSVLTKPVGDGDGVSVVVTPPEVGAPTLRTRRLGLG